MGVEVITPVRNNEALRLGNDLSIKTEMNYGLSIDREVGAWSRQSERISGKVTETWWQVKLTQVQVLLLSHFPAGRSCP